ncbi:MAG: sugar transferase [Rhodothermales bacterium]|nr:sugar transferase [Rhodothermales bacterium]MBO6781298.1 sugar transferase [Rhodothermales bacterium]
MTRRVELLALLLADALALMGANLLWHKARFEWEWFSDPVNVPVPALVWIVVLALSMGWLVVFLFFGMYRERYASSRFDEFVSLAKVVTIGILVMFFFLFIDQLDAYAARSNLVFYWFAVFGLVALGRFVVRSVQKFLILRGKGLHRALVVGWDDRLGQLYRDVAAYPEAGLEIVGAIQLSHGGDGVAARGPDGSVMQAGNDIADLPRLIDELQVQDVLIALGAGDQDPLLEVLRLCDGKPVRLKLVPDFYSVIGGMARTEHMYGLPLIEVMPEPMAAWEESTKRLIDLVASGIVLVVGAPVWLAIGLAVRLTSSGPAIYRQQRVGKLGRVFTMYKFRTMRQDAEAETGPVWATEDDPRYTAVGRWLRKTRLDEIPQFWNVFKGDMSLVGPRPERPYFVEKLAAEIPLYNRRHRVKPGITGWAQVKWKYDTSLDDVRQKVKYDLFYIENLGLRRDLQILLRTITTALKGSGQ